MDRDLFWLTEAQFARIEPHLPTDTRGEPRVDDRRVISDIVHVLKSGGRWIDAPTDYRPRKTLYNRYAAGPPRASGSISPCPGERRRSSSQVLIDSSAVQVRRSASGGNVWPAPSASCLAI